MQAFVSSSHIYVGLQIADSSFHLFLSLAVIALSFGIKHCFIIYALGIKLFVRHVLSFNNIIFQKLCALQLFALVALTSKSDKKTTQVKSLFPTDFS